MLYCKSDRKHNKITRKVLGLPALVPMEVGGMDIQLFYYNNHLISEQHPNEENPMFQLLYDKYNTSHPR